jgi:archaemetzincin
MKPLHLLPVGPVDERLLQYLKSAIPRCIPAACAVLPQVLDPAATFHGERQQYHSSEILRLMQGVVRPDCGRLLGVTAMDLYIPILTFVFGEAQMGGPCAVVSLHRLRQEFYGLPPDPDILSQRLLKEAVHELGHTLELTHCDDYRCAMAPSHAVEWIDLKETELCSACQRRVADGPGSGAGFGR